MTIDKFLTTRIIDELIEHSGHISTLELAWLKTIKYPSPSTRLPVQQWKALKKIHQRYIKEKILLEKHGNFYRELDFGERTPTTKKQKHFIQVCRGLAEPQTEHEIAYLKSKSAFYKKSINETPIPTIKNSANAKSSKAKIENEPRRVMYNSWLGLKRHKSNWW